MTEEHNSGHRTRVEMILNAEWDLDHPELQRLRETCRLCREDLSSLARTGRLVDASLSLEEETVRQGIETVTQADESFVQEHLEGLWAAGQRRLRMRVLRWTGVAAAAGLALWFAWGPALGLRAGGSSPPPKLQILATSSAELIYPTGLLLPGQAFDKFEWDVSLGAGETLTLRVWSEHAVEPLSLIHI